MPKKSCLIKNFHCSCTYSEKDGRLVFRRRGYEEIAVKLPEERPECYRLSRHQLAFQNPRGHVLLLGKLKGTALQLTAVNRTNVRQEVAFPLSYRTVKTCVEPEAVRLCGKTMSYEIWRGDGYVAGEPGQAGTVTLTLNGSERKTLLIRSRRERA